MTPSTILALFLVGAFGIATPALAYTPAVAVSAAAKPLALIWDDFPSSDSLEQSDIRRAWPARQGTMPAREREDRSRWSVDVDPRSQHHLGVFGLP